MATDTLDVLAPAAASNPKRPTRAKRLERPIIEGRKRDALKSAFAAVGKPIGNAFAGKVAVDARSQPQFAGTDQIVDEDYIDRRVPIVPFVEPEPYVPPSVELEPEEPPKPPTPPPSPPPPPPISLPPLMKSAGIQTMASRIPIFKGDGSVLESDDVGFEAEGAMKSRIPVWRPYLQPARFEHDVGYNEGKARRAPVLAKRRRRARVAAPGGITRVVASAQTARKVQSSRDLLEEVNARWGALSLKVGRPGTQQQVLSAVRQGCSLVEADELDDRLREEGDRRRELLMARDSVPGAYMVRELGQCKIELARAKREERRLRAMQRAQDRTEHDVAEKDEERAIAALKFRVTGLEQDIKWTERRLIWARKKR